MFVYKIMNIVNGKMYIGVTTKTVEKRWRAHLSNAFVKNVKYALYNAMRKYGRDFFSISLVYEAVNECELMAVEKGLIAQYGTMTCANGYNQSSGGESRTGIRLDEGVVERMRERTRKQIAENGHPMQGKKHSAEALEKMSAFQKTRPPFSEETRRKLSVASTGRVIPREAVERARQKRLGAKRTPEQIARIRAGRRLVTPRKNKGNSRYPVEFVKQAVARIRAGEKQARVAEDTGLHQGYLSQLIHGKRGNNLYGGIQ